MTTEETNKDPKAQKPTEVAAPPAPPAPQANEPNKGARAQKTAEPQRYRVAKGRSITSLAGILAPGEEVLPERHGVRDIDELVRIGAVEAFR